MRGRGTAGSLLAAVGLFLVWSNSFVAASFLLGGERSAARLDALGHDRNKELSLKGKTAMARARRPKPQAPRPAEPFPSMEACVSRESSLRAPSGP